MRTRQRELSGCGRTAPSAARSVDGGADELDGTVLDELAEPRGIIARGMGRAYGDPAQNGGGTVIRLQPSANPIRIDVEGGTATVDARVSFDELLRRVG